MPFLLHSTAFRIRFEIIFLLRLPGDCVCKCWNALIKDSEFVAKSLSAILPTAATKGHCLLLHRPYYSSATVLDLFLAMAKYTRLVVIINSDNT